MATLVPNGRVPLGATRELLPSFAPTLTVSGDISVVVGAISYAHVIAAPQLHRWRSAHRHRTGDQPMHRVAPAALAVTAGTGVTS
jgi:hypothetical protein